MKGLGRIVVMALIVSGSALGAERQTAHAQAVGKTKGLVAFWDFDSTEDGVWKSFYDPELPVSSYPLYLKRIGDAASYSTNTWPYADADSGLVFDSSGPFGKAVRFNKGYIYGAVERKDFDGTLLDIHGEQPFTLIAWVKFIGTRHMVAGIWDEGGWDKYGGRRQVALFGGLFRQKGVIMHVSATGAASYPQCETIGAKYARLRAIDGKPFEDNQWVSMAAVYDPVRKEVIAYLDGVMTPMTLTDGVAQEVYQYENEQSANPFNFPLPVYSPRNFIIKYNGYNVTTAGIYEHRLRVNFDDRTLTYEQDRSAAAKEQNFRVTFDIRRQGKSILTTPIGMAGICGQVAVIPAELEILPDDEVWTGLEEGENGEWKQVGTLVKIKIQAGAPFTFGRALGLGSEDLGHGSQLYMAGVAVFNRVLGEKELRALSFKTY
jgi:hypothetical protein